MRPSEGATNYCEIMRRPFTRWRELACMSATNAQDLKRFGKNTKDKLAPCL